MDKSKGKYSFQYGHIKVEAFTENAKGSLFLIMSKMKEIVVSIHFLDRSVQTFRYENAEEAYGEISNFLSEGENIDTIKVNGVS